MTDLKAELASIREQIEALEARKTAIYAESLNAPAAEKVCDDYIAEMLTETESLFGGSIQYPITITGIAHEDGNAIEPGRGRRPTGCYVAIKPCDPKCAGKTYLGIYLGDAALGAGATFHKETGVLNICLGPHNPAIYVPDLKRVVYGMESWWGVISKPDDLKQISDADINDIWYVRAAKEVGLAPVPLDGGA